MWEKRKYRVHCWQNQRQGKKKGYGKRNSETKKRAKETLLEWENRISKVWRLEK